MLRTPIGLIGVAFVATCALAAQDDHYEKRAIVYAKRISVSQLEAGLSVQRFAYWFEDTVGHQAKIKWEVNDCGEQSGTRTDIGRDFPSCVEANADLLDGRTVVVRIAVGTFSKGIWGHPTMYSCFIEDRTATRGVRSLSELRRVLSGETK